MTLLVTDAVVLHTFDYMESSRIYRLCTRDAGVQSVLARGARGSRKRFGSAVGPFASGVAQISVKHGRDLHTLTAFDVQQAHQGLAGSYDRFLGASLLAEIALRFTTTEANPEFFSALCESLEFLCESQSPRYDTLAWGWRLVVSLGFAPTLHHCAACGDALDAEAPGPFSHRAGGVLCADCAIGVVARLLPAAAREQLDAWIGDGKRPGAELSIADLRAHARLLREFVSEHMGDDRPLKAFQLWESAV